MNLKKHELENFTGTGQYYKHWLGIQLTDGAHHVRENGGSWIVDLIASYQTGKTKTIPFQVWKIEVTKQGGFVATMREDSHKPILITQSGEFTDLDFDLEMWLIDGILILPSEY